MARKKGDKLTKASNKARDRCIIKPGCTHGTDTDQGPQARKGSVVATQDFGGQTFYHVLIDDLGPPAFWYAADCLIMKQGNLRPLAKVKQARVKVKKGNYEATFSLDQTAVDSYIDEGFTVTIDDDEKEPS